MQHLQWLKAGKRPPKHEMAGVDRQVVSVESVQSFVLQDDCTGDGLFILFNFIYTRDKTSGLKVNTKLALITLLRY